MAAYTFVFVVIFIDKPWTGLTGLGILSAFVVLYFIVKGTKKISDSEEQENLKSKI